MDSDTLARAMGAWLGGFTITLLAGYMLLRFARSPGRRPGAARVLRVLAVLVAAFFVYGSYVGTGRVNLGSLFALLVVAVLTFRRPARRGSD